MPSMVVIVLPSASTPSIRQEHTILPSRMIVHAPQSPEAQPSLLPVSPSTSRSVSSMVCCVSHRNSTGSPLIVVVTWCLLISVSLSLRFAHGAVERDGSYAACQHAGDLGAVFDRPALVVDRLARRARRRIELLQRFLVQRMADQRVGRVLHQQYSR